MSALVLLLFTRYPACKSFKNPAYYGFINYLPNFPLQVSIIIVTYNSSVVIGGCLRSLRRLPDHATHEVMVVDNASTDGTVEQIEREFPEVTVLKSSRNAGFSAALNHGFSNAAGQFLFILNPDTIVSRDSLSNLLSFLGENKRAGIAGAQLTNLNGSLQDSTFSFPSLPREFLNYLPEIKTLLKPRKVVEILRNIIINNKLNKETSSPIMVQSVSGAAFLVRSEVVKQLEGFDEGFFVYHEELDFCKRARDAGWEVWSVPQAQVIHLDAQGTGYRRQRLPHFPVLQWRIAGMDRLWWKHRSAGMHFLWRCQTRGLLRFRCLILLIGFPFAGRRKSAIKTRIQELKKVIQMLYQKPVAECEQPG